ncbi:hypothetical protein ACIPZ8_14835 [Pseudomonas sp. NPDC089422]|uniref:hypothetical protein n=1 Tax=Pseudomonas sp. NPDC089422 TaxID=3364466 RepID=UPI0038216352
MPVMHVRAQGYVAHTYEIWAQENAMIVPSSFSYRVLQEDYVGVTFPLQVCTVKEVNFKVSGAGRSAEITLRYGCVPNNACPNFLIEFEWQEDS